MRLIKVMLQTAVLFASLIAAQGQGTISSPVSVRACLNGSCEIPPNDSLYLGDAIFSYDLFGYNPSNDVAVTYSINFPLPFAPIAAAIHGPAGPQQSAPIIVDLGTFKLVTNVIAIISWPESNSIYSTNVSVVCSNALNLTPQQMGEFKAGRWYVNVTSTNFPAGEVRGQITDAPVLSPVNSQPPNGFTFNVTSAGHSFQVEVSTNLASWSVLTNVTATNSLFPIVDPTASNAPGRFYRVILKQ